jgi:hypothetical protein
MIDGLKTYLKELKKIDDMSLKKYLKTVKERDLIFKINENNI